MINDQWSIDTWHLSILQGSLLPSSLRLCWVDSSTSHGSSISVSWTGLPGFWFLSITAALRLGLSLLNTLVIAQYVTCCCLAAFSASFAISSVHGLSPAQLSVILFTQTKLCHFLLSTSSCFVTAVLNTCLRFTLPWFIFLVSSSCRHFHIKPGINQCERVASPDRSLWRAHNEGTRGRANAGSCQRGACATPLFTQLFIF